MIQTINETTYSVCVNDKYICILGKSINIYNNDNLEKIVCFKELRYPMHAVFLDSNRVIVKNTTGTFALFDIANKTLIRKIKLPGVNDPLYANFILSLDKNYMLDITKNKDKINFYKINIETGEYLHVILSDLVGSVRSISYDKYNKSILILSTLQVGTSNDEQLLKTCVVSINYDLEFQVVYKTEKIWDYDTALAIYEGMYLLNEKMELIDILSQKQTKRLNFPNINNNRLKRLVFFDDNYLVLNYTHFKDKIIVYDLKKDSIVKELEFDNYSGVCINSGKLYVGQVDKLHIFDMCDLSKPI